MNPEELKFNALLQAIRACKTTPDRSKGMTPEDCELWDDAIDLCFDIIERRKHHFVKPKQ